MRTRRLWIASAVGVATLLVGTTVPAVAAARVSPKQYAQDVCTALTVFHTSTAGAPVTAAAQQYQSTPTQDTAIALRQAIIDELESVTKSFDYLVRKTRAAGTPDYSNGKQFAALLIDQEKTLAAKMPSLREKAGAIDVSSSAKFATTFKVLDTALKDAASSSKRQAARSSLLFDAPTAMQPIVAYLKSPSATQCVASS